MLQEDLNSKLGNVVETVFPLHIISPGSGSLITFLFLKEVSCILQHHITLQFHNSVMAAWCNDPKAHLYSGYPLLKF